MPKVVAIIILKLRLLFKGKRRVVAFDLPSKGEWQFIRPVIFNYVVHDSKDIILIVHNQDTREFFKQIAPTLHRRVIHVKSTTLRSVSFHEIDLFVTTEQYNKGLDGVYSISLCHGQAAKGLSFVPEIVETFDAFFLLGPIHKQAFADFVNEFLDGQDPGHLNLFEIGYPKSDDLINGHFSAQDILQKLSLDIQRKTILYAPAFNEGASLREYGIQIIKLLVTQTDFNIIAKLPIECWEPTGNFYATNGIDWFKEIQEIEKNYPDNFRLYTDYVIDPLLSCADVLITCISSVSFEFLALNKPVIFIDTPKYFSGYLKRHFPNKDTVSWSERTTVNGGREFGLVVADIHELPKTINRVLANPQEFPYQQERLKTYLLYNRGKGTEAVVDKIEQLLETNAKTLRPVIKKGLVHTIISGVWKRSIGMTNKILVSLFKRIFFLFGYNFQRTGEGYHDPADLLKSAHRAKLTVCEYLENREKDARKRGRRDRIIAHIMNRNILNNCNVILEIGTGTGMYLEKVLLYGKPKRYEIYETHPGWMSYLKKYYGRNSDCKFVFQSTDGATLKPTPSGSCQLVLAHGVFVYIPILKTFSYIAEAARVLTPEGYLIFDCYLDCSFGYNEINAWLNSEWRFPVILPEKTLLEYAEKNNLLLEDKFKGFVDYLIFKKKPAIVCAHAAL
jgi:SAM-dependent methyltransferase